MNEISVAVLHERLVYNPETGVLYWRCRPVLDHKTRRWNAQHAGNAAGNTQVDGYIRLAIDRVKFPAHRVVWAMVTGSWPSVVIDHINGNTSDNRFCNLREATVAQNCWNQKISTANISGFKGVEFHSRTGRWRARIAANGQRLFLGYFDSPELASRAYIAAASSIHGEFARAA